MENSIDHFMLGTCYECSSTTSVESGRRRPSRFIVIEKPACINLYLPLKEKLEAQNNSRLVEVYSI